MSRSDFQIKLGTEFLKTQDTSLDILARGWLVFNQRPIPLPNEHPPTNLQCRTWKFQAVDNWQLERLAS